MPAHRARGMVSLPVILAFAIVASACRGGQDTNAPVLVVLLVIDQFRADLLERYDPLFEHGFRRLLDDGYRFTHAEHDHAITNSSPGHATLATGRFPAHHGIVDNSWFDVVRGEMVTGPVDTTASILGYPDLTGISPRNRLTESLGDWILNADPEARAVVITQGAASAMGLAPKERRGEVYWSSPTAGGFVTSTYFRDAYPDWIRRFNQRLAGRVATDSVWESTIPPGAESLTRADEAPYEGDHVHTIFPHHFREEGSDPDSPTSLFSWIRSRPMHDAIILSLVREAITSERLGRRGATDYLGVNLSSLDDVGHDYGPWSREQLDALLRLDREIGDFLTYLDGELGPDGYVIAVTGDHGVATAPEYARATGAAGRRVTQVEMDSLFDALRSVGPPPEDYDAELARRVAELVEDFAFVADAITREELENHAPADSFLARYRNSYRPDRVPWFPLSASDRTTLAHYGVQVRLVEGAIPDYAVAVHGSPYDYDRRVPLIFLGAGIAAGSSSERVRSVDVAPTLAAFAGVAVPADLDGRVLNVKRAADSDR